MKEMSLLPLVIWTYFLFSFQVWDDTLATMAQQWSDTCTWGHGQPDNISPFSSLGQNLYIQGYGSQSSRVDGGGAVQAWYDEDQFFTYDTNTCQTNQVCGHYTQVISTATLLLSDDLVGTFKSNIKYSRVPG